MTESTRRGFFKSALFGAAGVAALDLPLPARATPSNGSLEDYRVFLEKHRIPELPATTPGSATHQNILGPYHREGAPFRGKVTPPLAPGQPLLVGGRVWGLDTRRPLPGVQIDVWQANHEGSYDHEGPAAEAPHGYFGYRIRVLTDESGWYEFETIHPAPYKAGPNATNPRPSHIHYRVRQPGYRELVTQLYFAGDPYNATDGAFDPALAVTPHLEEVNGQKLEVASFDLILEGERIS